MNIALVSFFGCLHHPFLPLSVRDRSACNGSSALPPSILCCLKRYEHNYGALRKGAHQKNYVERYVYLDRGTARAPVRRAYPRGAIIHPRGIVGRAPGLCEFPRISVPRTWVNRVWWAKVIFGGIRLGPRVHHRLCGIPALLPVRDALRHHLPTDQQKARGTLVRFSAREHDELRPHHRGQHQRLLEGVLLA